MIKEKKSADFLFLINHVDFFDLETCLRQMIMKLDFLKIACTVKNFCGIKNILVRKEGGQKARIYYYLLTELYIGCCHSKYPVEH